MQTETQVDSTPTPLPVSTLVRDSGTAAIPETTATPAGAPSRGRWRSDEERLREFGEAIDAVRAKIEAKIGKEDVDYIKQMRLLSRVFEAVGRFFLHFSFEPITWTTGTLALWLHKQMEATEIGHTALHGAFDGLEGAEDFQSKDFYWDVPIDEESWKYGHNIRHHQFTNVTGKDPDIHFGPIRLNRNTPHRTINYFQAPIMAAVATNFGFAMNMHFTGLTDYYGGNGRGENGKDTDFIKDRSWKTGREVHRKAFRKWIPYYAKNFGFWPLLAGPGFLKVLAGNFVAEVLRDLYSAATIYCGHVGEDVKDYPEGAKARNRGEWYAMQVEAANNFEVSYPVSVLCGALDRQIEHHLFPKFPTNRLREAAPEVKKICAEYGVTYKTDSWPNTLKKAVRQVWELSFPDRETAKPQAELAKAA